MIMVYPKLNYIAHAGTLYQWDYGQRLKICGVNLPDSYEVHYALANAGDSITVTGNATGADIPDELLENGSDIHGWVYVKNELTGQTIYEFILNVKKRAQPTTPREPIIPAEGEEF